MSWLNNFAKGSFSLFAGNTVDAFQPLDFYHFYPLWYDLWLDRIDKALTRLAADSKSYTELASVLPVPSSMRAFLQKVVPSYRGFSRKNPEQTARVSAFVARTLSEACPHDAFGESSALLIHSSERVREIVQKTAWQSGSAKEARMLGRFITAAGSLVHGLYNDLATDFGWDAYGPYHVVRDGKTYALLIRHFPDLAPVDLWPSDLLSPAKVVFLYALYEGVEWQISYIGCHTMVKSGSPIAGLREFAVVADGRTLNTGEIEKLLETFAQRAESLYRHIRSLDFEKIKKMVILQECYQTKKLLEAAGMDWKPTDEMIARVKGVPLLSGLVPHGQIMTSVDQYMREFGFHEFANEVLHQSL